MINFDGLEENLKFLTAEVENQVRSVYRFLENPDRSRYDRIVNKDDYIDKLKTIRRATNLQDNKTLVLHPASTIFHEYDAETRKQLGVPDNLIRISAGIEDPKDLIRDIAQALE